MYKDVGKRILAVMLCICMLVGMAHVSGLKTEAAGELTVEVGKPNLTFDGTVQDPNITVKSGGQTLTKDRDYDLSVEGPWGTGGMESIIDGGDYTVTVTGKSTYAGKTGKSKPFKVYPKTLHDLIDQKKVQVELKQVLVGSQIEKAEDVITLTDTTRADSDSYTLKGISKKQYEENVQQNQSANKGYDFSYELYADTAQAGNKVTVDITGINNYGHNNTQKQIHYEIEVTSKEFERVDYSKTVEYDTQPGKVPSDIKVYGAGNQLLTEGTHYTVTYYDGSGSEVGADQIIQAGIYSFTVRGMGDYAGMEKVNNAFTVQKNLGTYESQFNIVYDGEVFYTGGAVEPEVTITDSSDNGKKLEKGTDYTVSYTNNNTVSQQGANIFINGEGIYTGQIYKQFTIKPISLSDNQIQVEVEKASYIPGQAATPKVTVRFNHPDISDPMDITANCDFSYSNNNAAGMGQVKITGKNPNFTGERTVQFPIEAKSLKGDDITVLLEGEHIYDGQPFRPTVVVKYNNQTTLTENQDYRVTFSETSEATKEGIVTITGSGNYKDSVKKTYSINPAPFDGKVHVKVNTDKECVYTGKIVYPEIEVTYDGHKKPLVENQDYVIEAGSDNVNAGTNKQIIIRGQGNYNGTTTVEYEIKPKDISEGASYIRASLSPTRMEYTGNELKPTVTLNYNPYITTVPQDNHYVVEYSDNTDVTTDEKKAKVKIIGYGNFTGERTLTFDITKRSLKDKSVEATVNRDGQSIPIGELVVPYSGEDSPIKPDELYPPLQVWDNVDGQRKLLTNGTDYEFSYRKNVEIGKGELVLTGKGNYQGEIMKTFSIKGDLSYSASVKVKFKRSIVYTGEPITLTKDDIAVMYSYPGDAKPAAELVLGTDYEIVYVDSEDYTNVAAGRPFTIKALPGGDYFGELTGQTFDIVQKDLSNADGLKITIPEQTYTGSEISLDKLKNEMSLMYNGVELGKDSDYDIAYTKPDGDHTNCNDAVNITITAKDTSTNYTGSLVTVFKIVPRPLTQGEFDSGAITAVINGGDELILVEQENIALTESDLEVAYTNTAESLDLKLLPGTGDKPGDYTITIPEGGYTQVGPTELTLTGIGNFTGEIKVPFTIYGDLTAGLEKQDAEGNPITAINYDDTPYFTEGEVKPKVAITYRGVELVLDTDFTVDYSGDITEVTGEGQKPVLTVSGAGNYRANPDIEREYAIQKFDLSDEEAVKEALLLEGLFNPDGTPNDQIIYNKQPWEPLTGIKNHGTSVTPDFADSFTVEYKNNIEGSSAENEDISKRPTVIVTANADNPHYTGTLTAYFTIRGINFSNYNCTIGDIADCTYTGSPFTPTVEVSVQSKMNPDEVIDLVQNKDYVLTYENNIDAGTATVVITGINNFEGELRKEFTILPRSINGKDNPGQFIVTVHEAPYTGVQVLPRVDIVDTARSSIMYGLKNLYLRQNLVGVSETGVVLEEQKDYTLEAAGPNVDVGDGGLVNIHGTGNYTGTIENLKFAIVPGSMESVTVGAIADQTYQAAEIKPTPTVSLGQIPLILNKDYTFKYHNNVNVGTAEVEIVSLNGNLEGSATATFEIVQKSLKDGDIQVEPIGPQVYKETGAEPKPVVTYANAATGQSVTLKEGEDYTLTYGNNVEIGVNTASVTLTGVGNYKDVITETFSIVDDITLARFKEIPVQSWTGAAVTPKPELTKDDRPLVENTDYTLSYKNNVDAGKATVVVTGMGAFGGTLEIPFTIGRDFSAVVEAVGFAENYTYTGKEVKPLPGKVTLGDEVLTEGEDYTLTYKNNINVGEATVTINGAGVYSGSKDYQFTIIRKSVAQTSAQVSARVSYDGKTQTPAVTVKDGDTLLKKGTDYNVVYLNNEKPGTARVIINGRGNYTGSKVLNFEITMNPVSGVAGIANSGRKVSLSWKSVSGATGYEIYDSSNSRIARISGTGYSISGLKPGTSYTYRVRAYTIKGGQSFYSSFSDVTVKTN